MRTYLEYYYLVSTWSAHENLHVPGVLIIISCLPGVLVSFPAVCHAEILVWTHTLH